MVIMDVPPAAPDTRKLLTRACAGDADAFCRLIEPMQARLLAQATALASDPITAEDLVSETLVEAWKSLPRYDHTCRLSTWLYAILLHRQQKHLRRARRWPLPFAWFSSSEAEALQAQQNRLPASGLNPAESVARNETNERLRQCLNALPEKHREVILLRFFEDASLPDIAAVLGCSIGTVKSRLHHALEKLRQMKLNLPGLKGDKQI
jgi:RNA polymerase sigma-70 factor, ECF subfamily